MSTWKHLVGAIAPSLATALGGPLAGGAVTVLANKLLGGTTGDPVTDEAKISGLLANGMTPDLQRKILEAENAFRLEMAKIDADLDKSYLEDIQDARKTHSGNADVLTLGAVILVVWALLTGGTLWGLMMMLTGGIKVADVGVVATVFTVLGSTVGYVSNIAQQVVGFFFGSSRGSAQKNNLMADAISGVGKR